MRACRTLCYSLDESCEDKRQIVSRVKAMPKGTRDECCQTRTESRLSSFRGNAEVDTVSQPVIRVNVPIFQICARILGRLYAPRIDVTQFVPLYAATFGIGSSVTQAGQNAGAFGKRPHTIIFESSSEPKHFEKPDPTKESVVKEMVSKYEVLIITPTQVQEEKNPGKTRDGFDRSGCATPGNPPFFASRRSPCWIGPRWYLK